MRAALALVALGAACVGSDPLGTQPPVQAHLVVHVDPLAREGEGACETSGLERCGTLVASSWQQRVENLAWLTETWTAEGRAADVELGPEMALSWAGDPEILAALAAAAGGDPDFDAGGAPDAAQAVQAVAAEGREALEAGIALGVYSLGVHLHTTVPDGEGTWGSAPKLQEGAEPCEAWADDPAVEGSWSWAERVLDYGANSAGVLADLVDAPLTSYTGHLPQTLEGKIRVVEDPDGLDPAVTTPFTERFRPVALGSAYSECLTQAVDHPPFEVYPQDPDQSLLAGEGPPTIPGERVAGSLAEHLDAPTDGSVGAAGRRFLQLLLNWRYSALTGQPARPWTWTWHAHLFDLDPGQPYARDRSARDLSTRDGSPFRGDAEAVAALLDAFSDRGEWQGAAASTGGVVAWRLPEDFTWEGSAFSYGDAAESPPAGLDPDRYPYLPLVAERLAQAHLVCRGAIGDVEVWGLERCPARWVWAVGGPGYSCADRTEPEGVYVLVPPAPRCLAVPGGALRAGAVDDDGMGAPDRCGSGLEIPVQGLIVEPAVGLSWLSDICGPWGDPG